MTVRLAHSLATLLFTVGAVSSHFAYTTAGLDFEVPTSRGAEVYYLRLRWDAGSTWAGWAAQPIARPERALDGFDLGGTLLARPTRPRARSLANVLGFWRVDGPGDDLYVAVRYPGAVASRWWAVPSWLVLLILWGRPLWRWTQRLIGRRRGRVG